MSYSAIDIGSTPVTGNAWNSPYSSVSKANPANASGVLTTIEIYVFGSVTNRKVGTFQDNGSNSLTNRDYETLASINSGSKQTFTGKNMDVSTGDYLGIYDAGNLFYNLTGSDYYWYKETSNYVDLGTHTFTYDSVYHLQQSLYATGITVPDAPTNISATDNLTTKVTITWTTGTGETAGHDVYRDGSHIGSTVAHGTSTYDDTTGTVNQTYAYTVKAKNAAGDSVASSADNGTMVSGASAFTIDDSSSTSSADNIALTLASGLLAIADSASASSSDNVALTRNGGDLTITDSASLSLADNIVLTGNLILADSTSASSADNVSLIGNLTVQDSSSASSADTLSLIGNLIVNDSASLSSADNIAIARNGGDLSVDDSVSISTADNVSLIGNLIIADSVSAASADNVTVVRNGGDLTIDDSVSLSYADIVTLISNLQITDSCSASSAENVILSQASGTLTINDSGCLSSSDNVSLRSGAANSMIYFNVATNKFEYPLSNAMLYKKFLIDHTGRIDYIVKNFIITDL